MKNYSSFWVKQALVSVTLTLIGGPSFAGGPVKGVPTAATNVTPTTQAITANPDQSGPVQVLVPASSGEPKPIEAKPVEADARVPEANLVGVNGTSRTVKPENPVTIQPKAKPVAKVKPKAKAKPKAQSSHKKTYSKPVQGAPEQVAGVSKTVKSKSKRAPKKQQVVKRKSLPKKQQYLSPEESPEIEAGSESTGLAGKVKEQPDAGVLPIGDAPAVKKEEVPADERGGAIDSLQTRNSFTGQMNPISPPADSVKEASDTQAKPLTAPETSSVPVAASSTVPASEALNGAVNLLSKKKTSACEDDAIKSVYDLMIHDQHNTVGIMFELTAMRLAKRSLEQRTKPSSFEQMTSGNIKALEKTLAALPQSKEMQAKVLSTYNTFGRGNDLKIIHDDFKKMSDRNQNACYFSKNQRFQNNEASSFILAVTLGEKNSGLSDIDAATVWVVERARAEAASSETAKTGKPSSYDLGQTNGNLLNISTRVTRYLGRIEDGKFATVDRMNKMIEEEEKKLSGILAQAKDTVKVDLKACLMKETNNCENCTAARLQSFEKENIDIDKIQRSLLEKISKNDNLKMEQDLKGRMGDVTYDFSNFATQDQNDVIPKNPPRGRVDACGHALNAGKAQNANREPSSEEVSPVHSGADAAETLSE